MNGIKYLLDTNIILGIIKGNNDAIALLKTMDLSCYAYSSITRMELLGFTRITPHEIGIINELLNNMLQIRVDEGIENQTILLKQQYQIKLPDALILATAIIYNLELITLDKKLANKLK